MVKRVMVFVLTVSILTFGMPGASITSAGTECSVFNGAVFDSTKRSENTGTALTRENGYLFYTTSDGNITSVKAYVSSSAVNGNFDVRIFRKSDGSLTGGPYTINASGAAADTWVTLTLSTSVSVTANTEYVISAVPSKGIAIGTTSATCGAIANEYIVKPAATTSSFIGTPIGSIPTTHNIYLNTQTVLIDFTFVPVSTQTYSVFNGAVFDSTKRSENIGTALTRENGYLFYTTADGNITSVKAYVSSSAVNGNFDVRIFRENDGNLVGGPYTINASGAAADTWAALTLSTPVSVTANTEYVISAVPSKGIAIGTTSATCGAIANGYIVKPAATTSSFIGTPIGSIPTTHNIYLNTQTVLIDFSFDPYAVAPSETPWPTPSCSPFPSKYSVFNEARIGVFSQNTTTGVNRENGYVFYSKINGDITAVKVFVGTSAVKGNYDVRIFKRSDGSVAGGPYRINTSGAGDNSWVNLDLAAPLSIGANTEYLISAVPSMGIASGSSVATYGAITNDCIVKPAASQSTYYGTAGVTGVMPTGHNSYADSQVFLIDFTFIADPPPAGLGWVNPAAYPSNKISVVSPYYASNIVGDTRIIICAPGFTALTAKCRKQGSGFGTDSTVATINLNASGVGEFTFPASQYPYGPITIRIRDTAGSANDECALQLYNTAGVSWNEGLNSAPIPPAINGQGLSVVYSDDFTDPLSIANTDSTKTYSSHKLGYQDFSGIIFRDFESFYNPFTQVDTYLRIRADQNVNSTGLISSVHQDGTGFAVKVPAYFECKFIAPNAKGTWPAFWTLTNVLNSQFTDGKCDELDIIEGYGFDASQPQFAGMNGYESVRHSWGQTPDLTGSKHINMKNIAGQSMWYEGFHTYGVLITETQTVYYCDNIEVWRFNTMPVSAVDYHYFLINLAVGGASGWPYDLSRYNGKADMYVDWVRVYGLPQNVQTN